MPITPELENSAPPSFAVIEESSSPAFSRHRLGSLVFLVLIFAAAARPITDPDFWWHLKTGQYIIETRTIPHSDIFSVLRFGSEWVTHEWLSEVIMYSVFRVTGFAGLIMFFALVITISFWIAYRRSCNHDIHPYISGLVLILGAGATIPTWGVRPQMFSILFASIFLAILDAYYRDQKTNLIWWLIPLMILWVNLHAGFAVGLALILLTILAIALGARVESKISLFSIWQRIRRLTVLWLLTTAAAAINPNGLRIYTYPFETLKSHAQMRYIQEWRSPNFHDPMFLALLIFILVLFGVFALSNRRPGFGAVLIILATFAGTLRSARNVPFFVLVAMPFVAASLWSWLSARSTLVTPSNDRKVQSRVLSAILVLFVLVILPLAVVFVIGKRSITIQPRIEAENFPVMAVDFMKSHNLPQPIYNEYHWGGYLIWKLYPQYRVYIDGRADVYGDDLMEEFFIVHDGERKWRESLDRYGIRTVVVEPNTAIASLLREDAAWHNVFEDQQAVIFTR